MCIDDFCKIYETSLTSYPISDGKRRDRQGYLTLGEMMLIEVLFHFSPYKDFKHYYLYGICFEQRNKFKKLPCYQRFVALKQRLFMPLSILLHILTGEKTGVYFADSKSF